MQLLAKQGGIKVKNDADLKTDGNTSEVTVLRNKNFGSEIESGILSLGQDLRYR